MTKQGTACWQLTVTGTLFAHLHIEHCYRELAGFGDIYRIQRGLPWDVRVEKLAKSLNEAGNAVTIIARNLDQKPTNESTPGFQIRRIPRTQRLPRVIQKLI
ncbi:hypothetical protein, partial [Marinobacter sp. es.048]|uniref:hypothetical protein n=1 Tax=Marinobacter sp. es.048 TaxID=1761795 RepID=UPI001C0F01A0